MIVKRLSERDILERIDELLEVAYRSADLGNLDDPLAETVYILISQQTRETVYREVFADLRRAFPTWHECARAPIRQLERLLEPAGFHRRRARQLRDLLRAVEIADRERGIGPAGDPATDLSLDFLRCLPDSEAEAFLTTLPGIGPKSARCVLAYSLSRAAFPVDTHVHRIFTRLGLVSSNGRKADHDPFQTVVPEGMRKRLHINLVHHGRSVCRTQQPACGRCMLVSFCSGGRTLAATSKSEAPVAVDLFAGAGGMGYGFRKAGYKVALAIESERHAAQTYRFNNPGVPVLEARIGDTTRASTLRRYIPKGTKIDALVAGFPCQGYSAAGSRRPDDERNALYKDVARIARQLGTQVVVIENVPGLRRVNGQGFLDHILDEFEASGYRMAAHLLRACDFGVPQHRLRYFFLGSCTGAAPTSPEPTHQSCHERSGSSRQDLPLTPRLEALLRQLPALPAGTVAERYVENHREFFNMSTMNHSRRVIAKINTIRRGEGPISYRRLEPDEARTLIAGHRAMPVHPWLDRTISVREGAVIQGFPTEYFFCGPRSEQPLQVANAVPPPLAAAVATHLRKVCHLR